MVADLDFAHDVALVGVSDSEVQENLHRIEALAEAAGLKINVAKTKNMGVEASLTCDKCERKFKTVNGRKVHQSRYCGKPKAVATRVFSCKVQDVLGNELEKT